MSSAPKVDLSNIRQLLKIYTEIKTNLSTVELRDSVNKTLHKIAAFLKMGGLYVPRSKEISNGSLSSASWKIDHLLTTANYFVDEVGFQYGNLQDYKLYCPHRNGYFQVFTDVFGNVLDVDDDIVNAWYDDVTSFQPKLYNEMNLQIVAELLKHQVPCDIDEDETFGGLLAFESGVVFRLVKQSTASYDQIVKAIAELESRPIRSRRDITYMEGEAKILLTLKEMATSRPKFYHDHDFQNAVLSILELQKEFGSGSDHIRASQKFVELRKKMRQSQVTRGQSFEKLYEIYPPSIGSSNAETGTDLVEVAYQASCPRDDAPRAAGRKENSNRNSESTRRHSTNHRLRSSFCKTSNPRMGICVLSSRLFKVIDHLGINTGRKRKGQDDMTKPGKTHAALANSKGLSGKSKKSTQKPKGAISMPRN
jgi:hypothetical protein